MVDTESQHRKVESVQVMRAVCMMLVLLAHGFTAYIMAQPPGSAGLATDMLKFCIAAGEWVLDLFFLGSGFIMVYVTQKSFGHKGAWKEFLIRRATRLVPTYWFYMTLAIIVSLTWSLMTFQDVTLERAIKSYLFIPYHANEVVNAATHPYPILIPGWTLNYELLFYVAFASVLFLQMRQALMALAGIIVVLITVHAFVPVQYAVPFFWTSPQILKFFTGCLIGFAFNRGVIWNIKPALAALIIVVAFLLDATMYYVFKDYDATLPIFVGASILAGIIGSMLALTPLAHKSGSPLLIRVGDATYSIYLCQNIVLGLVVLVPHLYWDIAPWMAVIMSIFGMILTVICGLLSYQYIELGTARALRQRFLPKRIQG